MPDDDLAAALAEAIAPSGAVPPNQAVGVGDKLTALSKIEKDQQRCQTSQLMVLWTM